jgi:hypothetical protein
MNQKQILPALEVNCCPFKHNNLCSRKWSAKFINHEIICNCECHRKMVLGRDESLPNTINSPLNRNGEYVYQ